MMRTRPTFPRLSDEGGFTLAVAMGIMLIASIVSVAAFQAATGDLVPSGENSDRKVAYAAAESGIAWYQSQLTANPDYWQQCASGQTNGVPDPVNQVSDPEANRKWRTVSGSGTSTADFNLAVLPASGSAACSTSNAATSMISPVDGSFRVRSTGRYHGQRRTIITSFKRRRFLDFLYFTDYETLDYSTYNSPGEACAQYRASRPSNCVEIQFANGDKVNGPLHTNDSIIYCGAPTFGRTSADTVSVSGPKPGIAQNSNGCSSGGAPVFNGTFRYAQPSLQMPPTNGALKALTTPGFGGAGYLLKGTQYIRFNGNGTMTVDTPNANPQTVSLPSNGVIYVDPDSNLGCGNPQTPAATDYGEGAGCANVYVSGTADKSVTIGSDRDIIVAPTTSYTGTDQSKQFDPSTAGSTWADANLQAAGTLSSTTQQLGGQVKVGLIANRFVRVYHRVGYNSSTNSLYLASGVRDVRIDAAILSLQHSFLVDNWAYGPSPGNLTVHGAIAQRFRGPVGTGANGSISTGYLKDYWYDNRLRYSSPPYFLDPVNSAWGIGRENEVAPPT